MATIQRPGYMDEERKQDSVAQTIPNNPQMAQPPQSAAPAPQLGSGPSTQVGGGQGLNASGNKAMAGQSASQYTQSSSPFSRINSLLQKNQGKQAAPNLAGGVQEQASKGQDQLQAQANDYVQPTTPRFKTTDAQAAARDAAGGQNLDTVRQDLNADTSRRKDFSYDGNTSFDGLNAFTSREGTTTALAKANADRGYTQGMGKIDSTLLGVDRGFQAQADSAQKAAGSFLDAKAAKEKSFNAQGGLLDQEAAKAQGYQAELRRELQGQADSIARASQDAGQWQNSKNAAARQARADAERQVLEAFKAQRSAEFANNNPFLQQNLKLAEAALRSPELAGLFDAGQDAAGMSEADAARYNNLQGLLGGALGQAGTQGRAASFDERAYRDRGKAALDALIAKLLVAPNQTPSVAAVGPGTVGRPEDTARNANKSTQGVVDKAVKDVKEAVDPRTAPKKGVEVAKAVAKKSVEAAKAAPKAVANAPKEAPKAAQSVAKRLLGRK